MSQAEKRAPSIGPVGALSIGIGGIVGGGFFATFGLTIAGAKGATPLSFVIAGLIALLTAYSYIGLTLTFPGRGGTVTFVRTAFGHGVLAASVNVLLILSYVAIMAVYAVALASYSVPYFPEEIRAVAGRVIASGAIIALGFVNFAGAALMERLETLFNVGKLGVLGLFIVAGLVVGHLEWSQFEPAEWGRVSTIIASGMLGFLAYEGFELIANAAEDIKDPKVTLPIAFIGSVVFAIVIYVLAFIVSIGHMSFAAIEAAKTFAVSAVAATFLGPPGFAIMAVGAILASASAINADYFGAAKLPVMLAEHRELPAAFQRRVDDKPAVSLVTIGVIALIAVNVLDLHALSAATSGGFLVVYAAVNLAAVRLAPQTGSRRWISLLAAGLCVIALVVMVAEFLSHPTTRWSGVAVAAVIALAILIEITYRISTARQTSLHS